MKTLQMHRLDGTFKQSRHGDRLEVEPLTELIIPTRLSLEEKEVFRTIGQKLADEGAICELDLCLLEAYSIQVCLMRLAHRSLQKSGHVATFKNKAGHKYEVPSGWVAIQKSATDLSAKLGAQLGLSPISRAKVPREKPIKPNNGLLK